jgi:hypothetical protein
MNHKFRRSIRRACFAFLAAYASTACATINCVYSAAPVDRGTVRQALLTSDGELELHFENLSEGWNESNWNLPRDIWCPVLELSGTELDQLFSQSASEASTAAEWPRVLIPRDRLKERTLIEPVGETPPEATVPVADVRYAHWSSWPGANAATEQTPSSLHIAFDIHCRDPIAGGRRSFAVLLVRDGKDGRRRAVLCIEPAPERPMLPVLAMGLAFDLGVVLVVIGLAAL